MRKCLFAALFLVFCPLLVAQQAPASAAPTATGKPRVFITDSQSWEMAGSAAGSNGSFAAESHGGARPQTAEIVKTFGKRCSEVVVNNKQEFADYIVLLDHEGGKGLLQHKDKVAVFERVSGDAVVSHSTLSLGGSVEDACNGIVQHWASHSKELLDARATEHAAPAATTAPAAVAAAPPPTVAQASVSIDSTPPGADIEVDGGFVGNTPSTVTLVLGSHEITVKKKGFADWTRKLNVTSGNIHLDAELEAAPPPAPAAVPDLAPTPAPAATSQPQ